MKLPLDMYACLATMLIIAQAPVSLGVTRHSFEATPFIEKLSQIKPGLALPSRTEVITVSVSQDILRMRALQSESQEAIEPLTIMVPTDKRQLDNLAIDLALPGRANRLHTYLSRNLEAQKEDGPEKPRFLRVAIDRRGLALVDLAKIASMLERPHQEVLISGRGLQRDPVLTQQLLQQIRPFLSRSEFQRVQARVRSGQNINVERELLPEFARRMVRRYIPYRGPNCFHAALAFHGEDLTRSPYINFRDEPGYHRAMINYDELWRIVQKSFYEIDPRETPLKYGDMILFFDVADTGVTPHFRWIRHAATYLFGPYTFSKGSKSPNTPYTIKTVAEEWDTWERLSKNLGVKVFRRSPKNVTTLPPRDRLDWIY